MGPSRCQAFYLLTPTPCQLAGGASNWPLSLQESLISSFSQEGGSQLWQEPAQPGPYIKTSRNPSLSTWFNKGPEPSPVSSIIMVYLGLPAATEEQQMLEAWRDSPTLERLEGCTVLSRVCHDRLGSQLTLLEGNAHNTRPGIWQGINGSTGILEG